MLFELTIAFTIERAHRLIDRPRCRSSIGKPRPAKTYQLNSMGTLVPRLPPFRTYPYGPHGLGGLARRWPASRGSCPAWWPYTGGSAPSRGGRSSSL